MKTLVGLLAITLAALAFPLGCATTGATQEVHELSGRQAANATVYIKGLACPYCVYNVERSLQDVDGVDRVETDLNTGIARVWFTPSKKPNPKDLWRAVKDSGFTPSKIVIGTESYEDL